MGILVEGRGSLTTVHTRHRLLPDVWVALVVRQSGIMVLVALATLPSAHL